MSHTLYEAAVVRVQRCELAVPGSNPGMFEKAMKSGADFVFLDLEDAVAPDDKLSARRNVIEALNDLDWRAHGVTISVRINGLDTQFMVRDVVDLVEQAGDRTRYLVDSESRRLRGCIYGRGHAQSVGDAARTQEPDRYRGIDRDCPGDGECRGYRA